MRESVLEQFFSKRVRLAGGLSFKLAPTTAGLPDRMVLWPGGRIHVVELKTENGRLSEVQNHMHEKMATLGTYVYVLHGPDEVVTWIRHQVNVGSPFPQESA
jgi:hypothetical protein